MVTPMVDMFLTFATGLTGIYLIQIGRQAARVPVRVRSR